MTSATDDLPAAITELRRKLPGWWFSVGECSLSCDATVGPDRAYLADEFLDAFDGGFAVDLRQPSTLAEALRAATAVAVAGVSAFHAGQPIEGLSYFATRGRNADRADGRAGR